jgi:sterol desaturase/sphingolipid hydroxylase (fatty acid hydroxylase superfamily)
MENSNYLAFAIPGFFLLLFIEYRIAIYQKRKSLFRFERSVSNLSIGIAERLLNLFISVSFFSLFQFVYKHYALFDIPDKWYVWISLLLATDFVWYWYHRLGHEVNILWAAHIVHHQSEEFNLTVSARITTFQAIIRGFFWCALPLLGFEPTMVMTILVVHGDYSFFTHTQLVRKLGWIEHFLVTPSIHGIHHASDEKYLDKNYGDVFVFWDKLFGTFQREEEKPKYGLTHQLQSHSFLWQHFHYYLEIIEGCKREKGWKKLRIIFGSPAIMDQDIRPKLEKRFIPDRKEHGQSRFKFKKYLYWQLGSSVLLLTVLTALYTEANAFECLIAVSLVLITLINCGALLEQRKWIYYLEYVRLSLVLIYISYYLESWDFLIASATILYAIHSLFALDKIYGKYVLRYDIT